LLATCLLACASRGGRPAERPLARFEVEGPGASYYRSTVSAGEGLRGPHAAQVANGIARAASERGQTLTPDPRLGELAAQVAAGLDEQGSPPPYPVIELWTRHLGLFEPTPHLIVLGHPHVASLEQRIVDEVGQLLPQQRYTHYGAVTIDQGGAVRVVLALSWRWVELEPVPRTLAPGARLLIAGRTLPGVRAAQLVVSYPDGTSERGPPQPKPEFSLSVPTHGTGEHRVELLAISSLGTTVVANFPVYVGIAPPTAITVEPELDEGQLDESEVQARMLALINGERARARLPALALHAGLTEIALAHSEDMQEHGFVGHTSPTTGTAAERVARAGVRTPLVLENIGRGYGPREVHGGLMDSPGHRANVLSADATPVGIGVLATPEDDRVAYLVTELFARMAAKIDVDDAPEQLLETINRARGQRRLPALESDAALSDLCAASARAYFGAPASHTRQQMVEQLNRRAASRHKSYTRLAALLTVVTSLAEAAAIDALLDPKARALGIGIAQGTRQDSVENAIVVVMVIGY
jgi:uncharacterized protein YkwD